VLYYLCDVFVVEDHRGKGLEKMANWNNYK
jgi:hypothetical protein